MLRVTPQVKLGDHMSGEKHVPYAIDISGPNSHRHAGEGLAYLEDTAKKADPASVVNTAYDVIRPVLQWWKVLRKWSLAHLILAGRGSKVEGLMGSLQVVDVPPGVEGSLAVRQISKASALQQLNGQGSVEALVFSLCLRVIGASMTDPDAPNRISQTVKGV